MSFSKFIIYLRQQLMNNQESQIKKIQINQSDDESLNQKQAKLKDQSSSQQCFKEEQEKLSLNKIKNMREGPQKAESQQQKEEYSQKADQSQTFKSPEKFENTDLQQNQNSKESSSAKEEYPQIPNEQQETQLLKQMSKKSEENQNQYQNPQRKSLLISIEDTQTIPSVYLQPSPKGRKPIHVKIIMYNVSTFMKMETQIFVIDVHNPNTNEEYQINRRYSDFVSFYQSIIYNQIGYIISPFPQKSFDSFMKIKLGLGSNHEGQRCQLIQKRMAQLQKFTNSITSHKELSTCEQLSIFLQKNQQNYEKEKRRIQNYVEQYKNLQSSWNLKNLMEKSASFFSSYLTHDKKNQTHLNLRKNDIQFGIILQTVRAEKAKHFQFLKHVRKLQEAERNLGQFTDIQTDIDSLLLVCAKHTSGRQYCLKFSHFLQSLIIDNVEYNIRSLEEVQKNLVHRVQIIEVAQDAKKKGETDKNSKIQRRIERFQRNFMLQWQSFNQKIKQNYLKICENLEEEWKSYKNKMSKIWKIKK